MKIRILEQSAFDLSDGIKQLIKDTIQTHYHQFVIDGDGNLLEIVKTANGVKEKIILDELDKPIRVVVLDMPPWCRLASDDPWSGVVGKLLLYEEFMSKGYWDYRAWITNLFMEMVCRPDNERKGE